jgi:hypothetical protein
VTQIRAANIRGSIKPAARRIAIAGAIGTIALLVGFTLVEAGYRLVLLRTDPR